MGHDALIRVFEESKELGFLGPGDVQTHIDHADRFVEAVSCVSGDGIDLGTGGGVPGILLATAKPRMSWSFLDSNSRRCAFLEKAIDALDLKNARVLHGRAEVLARREDLRHSFAVATARSFGAPGVLAECATGFLAKGAHLVVSEPPDADDRWPLDGLAELGMGSADCPIASVKVLRQQDLCGERWPRRVGIPSKRPLF